MKFTLNKIMAIFWIIAMMITLYQGIITSNIITAIICSTQALIMIVIVNQYVLLDKIGGKK